VRKVFYTARFKRLYRKLPQSQKTKLNRQLELLAQDMGHPSLGTKKMVNQPDVWEARIDIRHRFTFNVVGDRIILRAVGTHRIYRKP
jgi:mRNA-degrading endonuclease RelE of RelBE toxin-antitoxin system